MNKLLFTNQRLIDLETFSIKANVSELQYLNDFFRQNKLGYLTHVLLHKIISDPNKVVADIIKTKIPDVDPNTGLKNNKDKILSQIDLPEIDKSKISHLKLFIEKGYDSFYDFGDEVTLSQERLKIYFDKHRFYTDDPDVLKAYDDLNALAVKLNELNARLKILPLPATLPSDRLDSKYTEDYFKQLSSIFEVTQEGFRLQSKGFQTAVYKAFVKK